MPRPLSQDLRERIRKQLDAGESVREVSQRFLVGESTVRRLQKADTLVPRKQGGYRHSKLNREQIVQLSQLALENRKRSGTDIRQLAIERGLIEPGVSLSTIYRALNKTGLKHGRLSWKDPKLQTDPLIAYERRRFRFYQRTDPVFAPERLIFFDESNYPLWAQFRRGWIVPGQKNEIPRPKGVSPRVSVFATIGAPDILHYKVYRPRREYKALGRLYESSELSNPGRGIKLPYTVRQLKKELRKRELEELLKEHGVRTFGANKAVLIERAVHLKTKGLLGLPRRGHTDKGGKLMPVLNTAADVFQYFHSELIPTLGHSIAQRRIVMDNERIDTWCSRAIE